MELAQVWLETANEGSVHISVFRTADWGAPNSTNYYGPVQTDYPNETTCAFRAFRADAGQPDEYRVIFDDNKLWLARLRQT